MALCSRGLLYISGNKKKTNSNFPSKFLLSLDWLYKTGENSKVKEIRSILRSLADSTKFMNGEELRVIIHLKREKMELKELEFKNQEFGELLVIYTWNFIHCSSQNSKMISNDLFPFMLLSCLSVGGIFEYGETPVLWLCYQLCNKAAHTWKISQEKHSGKIAALLTS